MIGDIIGAIAKPILGEITGDSASDIADINAAAQLAAAGMDERSSAIASALMSELAMLDEQTIQQLNSLAESEAVSTEQLLQALSQSESISEAVSTVIAESGTQVTTGTETTTGTEAVTGTETVQRGTAASQAALEDMIASLSDDSITLEDGTVTTGAQMFASDAIDAVLQSGAPVVSNVLAQSGSFDSTTAALLQNDLIEKAARAGNAASLEYEQQRTSNLQNAISLAMEQQATQQTDQDITTEQQLARDEQVATDTTSDTQTTSVLDRIMEQLDDTQRSAIENIIQGTTEQSTTDTGQTIVTQSEQTTISDALTERAEELGVPPGDLGKLVQDGDVNALEDYLQDKDLTPQQQGELASLVGGDYSSLGSGQYTREDVVAMDFSDFDMAGTTNLGNVNLDEGLDVDFEEVQLGADLSGTTLEEQEDGTFIARDKTEEELAADAAAPQGEYDPDAGKGGVTDGGSLDFQGISGSDLSQGIADLNQAEQDAATQAGLDADEGVQAARDALGSAGGGEVSTPVIEVPTITETDAATEASPNPLTPVTDNPAITGTAPADDQLADLGLPADHHFNVDMSGLAKDSEEEEKVIDAGKGG